MANASDARDEVPAWMQEPEYLGQLMTETARLWRSALDRRLAPLGLSRAQWQVLLHVVRNREPMTQKELARRVGVEAPSLVGLLDRMARNGWIERSPCDHDRRSKTVHLTEHALGLIDQIEEIAGELRRELMSGLSRKELDCCLRVLSHLRIELEERA